MEQQPFKYFGSIIKMYDMKIEVDSINKGLRQVKTAINKGITKGSNKTLNSMRDNAMRFLEQAMQNHRTINPKTKDSTGILMGNINVQKIPAINFDNSLSKGYVFTNVDYAKDVEYQSNYEAYLFMTKAYEKGKISVKDNIRNQIKTSIRNTFGGNRR